MLPLALMAGGALGGLLGGGGSQSINQAPQLTEEQKRMLKLLSGVASSGSYNGMKFGDTYSGSLGDFKMTGMETSGQNTLQKLLGAGYNNSGLTDAGNKAMMDVLNGGAYDPNNDNGLYAGFKKKTMRDLQDSTDTLNRSLGSSGALFSTARIGENRKLVGNAQDALMNKLAELYDTNVQRKLNLIPTALSSGLQETQDKNNTMMNLVAASQQFGALPRTLNTAKDTAAYNEWIRAREEKAKPLSYAGTVTSTNANFQPTSYPTSSPWQQLFNTASGIGGMMLGTDYYNGSGIFGSKSPSTPMMSKKLSVNGYPNAW